MCSLSGWVFFYCDFLEDLALARAPALDVAPALALAAALAALPVLAPEAPNPN